MTACYGFKDILKSTHAYITEAPPPATIVQILPLGLSIVNLREAPLLASRSAMYAS